MFEVDMLEIKVDSRRIVELISLDKLTGDPFDIYTTVFKQLFYQTDTVSLSLSPGFGLGLNKTVEDFHV